MIYLTRILIAYLSFWGDSKKSFSISRRPIFFIRPFSAYSLFFNHNGNLTNHQRRLRLPHSSENEMIPTREYVGSYDLLVLKMSTQLELQASKTFKISFPETDGSRNSEWVAGIKICFRAPGTSVSSCFKYSSDFPAIT